MSTLHRHDAIFNVAFHFVRVAGFGHRKILQNVRKGEAVRSMIDEVLFSSFDIIQF